MGGHVNTVWTDEQSDVLVALLAQGKSFSQIAAELNAQFNTTYSRNAACGKSFRLRVTAPPKIKAPPRKRKRQRQTTRHGSTRPPMRTEEIQIRCIEIKTQNVSILELEGCRYPSGDGPFTFCNHQQQFGLSYCPAHEALCHGAAPKVSAEERLRRRLHWKKLQKLNSIFPLGAAE